MFEQHTDKEDVMRVVCMYAPDVEYTKPRHMMAGIRSGGFRDAALFESLTPFDYWRMIKTLWEDGHGFVNIEQDIIASAAQVHELVNCREEYCAFPFWTWDDRTLCYNNDMTQLWYEPHEPRPQFSHTCQPGDPYASMGGIGLSKFGGELLGTLPKRPWFCVDWVVNEAMARMGKRWHMHWPHVAHERDPRQYQNKGEVYEIG